MEESALEAKRANAELTRLNQTLKQKSAEQRRVFAIISHELRTPASALTMLAQQLNIEPEERSELGNLSGHLLNVIDDLRTALNPEEEVGISAEVFGTTQLLEQTERQVSDLCTRHQMSFAVVNNTDDVYLVGDIYRLRVILTNLIRNAALHSKGSRIVLSAAIGTKQDDCATLHLRVDDNGVGIPDRAVDRLFLAFERGNTTAGGTGVGLHIVKHWTELMGGTVAYERNQEGGASFVLQFELPLNHKDN